MSTSTPVFRTDALGVWSEPREFAVSREAIRAYAEATNDRLAAHAAGDLAPPVFAVVPAFEMLAGAAATVIPSELLMMLVHGEQDFSFHQPIRPGTTLQTRAATVGVHPRSTGVTVTVRGETRDAADGALLVEQLMTAFVRGARSETTAGEAAPSHGFDEALRSRPPDAEVAQTFDADQTFRYSAASGDPMPIHLDDELARAMGLPGIIIHGLCTMAFTSQVVIGHACPDDPTRLRRLAVRFARVVEPRQTITTRVWDGGAGRLHFETTSDSGDVVIRDGLAEIAG
ncbi:MAG: MaoC/PaaZ C-terminal domain-containing protein [Candidatus Dormibacteria bacterium]